MHRYHSILLLAFFAVVVVGIGVGVWLNTPSPDPTATLPTPTLDTRSELPPDTLPDAQPVVPADLTPTQLPDRDAWRDQLWEATGLVVVQETASSETATAQLIGQVGKVHHRFNRHVTAVTAIGDDLLVLTDRDMVRLGADGEVQWTAPFGPPEFCAGGGLVTLADGSVVGYLYCEMSDSGVQLIRVDQNTGRKRWEADCPSLGVWHSKYRHQAVVVADGGRVKVTSRASGGTFVEVLDARTGKRLDRKQDKKWE